MLPAIGKATAKLAPPMPRNTPSTSSSEYDGVPESWMAYIAVDDIDTRLRKAAQAGAKVMKEPLDVPGVGRIAILSEPGGAGIGWMTPA